MAKPLPKRQPTPLQAMELECADLARKLATFGLGFQLQAPVVLEIALVRLLVAKGLCTEDEWRMSVAETKRDLLIQAVSEAPDIKARMQAEARKQQLVLPPHLQASRN
jgi:hypothetical protein